MRMLEPQVHGFKVQHVENIYGKCFKVFLLRTTMLQFAITLCRYPQIVEIINGLNYDPMPIMPLQERFKVQV